MAGGKLVLVHRRKKKTKSHVKGAARRGGMQLGALTAPKGVSQLFYKSPHHMPFPQEYVAKFRTIATGYVIPGGANPDGFAAGATLQHYIKFNDCTAPFGGLMTTGLNASNPTLSAPAGFNRLCNANLYQTYEVLNARVKVTIDSLVATDIFGVTITPNNGENNDPPSFSSGLLEPWGHYMKVVNGANPRALKHYVDIAKFLGVDKKIYRNTMAQGGWDAKYNLAPSSPLYFVINYNTLNGVAPTAAKIPIQIEMIQTVRLFNFTSTDMYI